MVGNLSTSVRFFSGKCCTILAVFPLLTVPACGWFVTSGRENSRALLDGQDVAPLFLSPRALKLYSVGDDSFYKRELEAGVPFALLTADSD